MNRCLSLESLYEYSYNSRYEELDGIEAFVRVVEAGSFSAAARLLEMPVTTISGQVASLEKRLGVTLIHQTTRKLSVSKAGENYYKHCALALAEISAGESELATGTGEPDGLLKITAPPDVGHTLLPNIIRRYLKDHPKVRVELILTNRFVDLVGEGVDLAIRVGHLKDSSLVAQKFVDVDAGLQASKAYLKKFGFPREPKDLKEHSFIGMKAFPHVALARGRQSETIELSSRIVADDMEAIKLFTLAGDGIAILPTFLCQTKNAEEKLIRVLPEWSFESGPKVQFCFVFPPQRFVL